MAPSQPLRFPVGAYAGAGTLTRPDESSSLQPESPSSGRSCCCIDRAPFRQGHRKVVAEHRSFKETKLSTRVWCHGLRARVASFGAACALPPSQLATSTGSAKGRGRWIRRISDCAPVAHHTSMAGSVCTLYVPWWRGPLNRVRNSLRHPQRSIDTLGPLQASAAPCAMQPRQKGAPYRLLPRVRCTIVKCGTGLRLCGHTKPSTLIILTGTTGLGHGCSILAPCSTPCPDRRCPSCPLRRTDPSCGDAARIRRLAYLNAKKGEEMHKAKVSPFLDVFTRVAIALMERLPQ